MAVPSWFNYKEYFNNKAAAMGIDALELKAKFEAADYNVNDADSMYDHFVSYGNAEGVSPNASFDVASYMYAKAVDFYSKLQGVDAKAVYVTEEMLQSMYNAMEGAGMSPWDHYNAHGAFESAKIDGNSISGCLNPSESFDADRYMMDKLALMQEEDADYTMQDLVDAFKDAGYTPLMHYLLHAQEEGLTATKVANAIGNPGKTINLTEFRDTKFGTNADDQFHARVAGDLDDGDYIDGYGGYDTLYATTGEANDAAQPQIVNVEKIVLQAQSATEDGGNNATSGKVNFDAGSILGKSDSGEFTKAYGTDQGLVYLANDDSRANLVVEDVRSMSTDMTIGWFNADPTKFDATTGEAMLNWEVYFSTPYLAPYGASSTGTIAVEIMDVKNSQSAQAHVLTDNVWDTMIFTINGVEYTLTAAEGYDGTIQSMYNALQAALAEDSALDALIDLSLQEETYTATGSSASSGPYSYNGGQRIVVTANTGDITFDGWTSSEGRPVPPEGAIAWAIRTGTGEVCPLLQTNIHLDNVGTVKWVDDYANCLPDEAIFGSESGNMIVGAADNRGGLERFDVVVDRGSWLSSLSSTNNTLRMVTVQAGDINQDGDINRDKAADNKHGELFIGRSTEIDSDTQGHWTLKPALLTVDGLTDVKYFTAVTNDGATVYNGNLNIGAQLTAEAYAKYMADVDQLHTVYDNYAPSGSFEYNLGSGADILNMEVNGGLAADNDFVLNINAGAGNDLVNFSFTDITHNNVLDSAYLGKDNLGNVIGKGNVNINMGTGNDTVWSWGDGAVNVNGGDGADAIYVGQLGDAYQDDSYNTNSINDSAEHNAVWAFNVDPNHKLVDFRADGAQAHANDFLATDAAATLTPGALTATNSGWQLYVTVRFDGFVSEPIAIKGYSVNGNGQIVDAQNKVVGTQISTLAINNAIIEAINTDDVLGKVLVAKDGAGYGLIVESLIDGSHLATDLGVGFSVWNGATGTAGVAMTDTDGNYTSQIANEAQVVEGPIMTNTGATSVVTTPGTDLAGSVTTLTTGITTALTAGQVITIEVDGTYYTTDAYVAGSGTLDAELVALLRTAKDATGALLTATYTIADNAASATDGIVVLNSVATGAGEAGAAVGALGQITQAAAAVSGTIGSVATVNLGLTAPVADDVIAITLDGKIYTVVVTAVHVAAGPNLSDILVAALQDAVANDGTAITAGYTITDDGGSDADAIVDISQVAGTWGNTNPTINVGAVTPADPTETAVPGTNLATQVVTLTTGVLSADLEDGDVFQVVINGVTYTTSAYDSTGAAGDDTDLVGLLQTAVDGAGNPINGTYVISNDGGANDGVILFTAPAAGAVAAPIIVVNDGNIAVTGETIITTPTTGFDNGTYSINRVEGGAGDDVIVLNVGSHIDDYTGTNFDYRINDTLVITDKFGDDSVFNFDVVDAGYTPANNLNNNAVDMIDVSAIGTVLSMFSDAAGGAGAAQTRAAVFTDGNLDFTKIAGLLDNNAAILGNNVKGVGIIQIDGTDQYYFFSTNVGSDGVLAASEVELLGTITFDMHTGDVGVNNIILGA